MSAFRDGYIYRVCCPRAWDALTRGNHIPYSHDDSKDGYFHLSAPDQVLETAAIVCPEYQQLVAVGCPEEAPGKTLKWEESRNGEKFPHVYGDVRIVWFDHVVPLHKEGDAFVVSPNGIN